jgi:plastocyanin domain-containing protein
MRIAILAVLASGALLACNKEPEKLPETKPIATKTTGTVAPDGVRAVQIEANKDGFVPDKIPGKPGEKLKLVFTRKASGGECMAELKSPDGKLHKLPMDKPYEIAVTVPDSGEVKFACGMEMFFGVVVADKS